MFQQYVSQIHGQMKQMSNNIFEKTIKECNHTLSSINEINGIFTLYSESDFSIINDLKKYDGTHEYTTYDVFRSNNNIKFTCQSLIYTSNYINGIFLFTPSNEVLGYGYGGNIDISNGYTPYQDEWYKETLALHGSMYVSEVSQKDFLLNSKKSITFSKALYDVLSKQFLGVLVIDCSPKIFDLNSINTLPEAISLTLKNDKNDILYTNKLKMKNPHENVDVHTENLSTGGLTITAETYYDILYKGFNRSLFIIALLSVCLIILSVLISAFLSNYISEPILILTHKMSSSKLTSLYKSDKYLHRNDEIGLLYNEYNNMIQQLENYIKTEYQNKLIIMDSQMKAFEAQINSHFLYNTLESINSVAEIEGIDSISVMSMALGNMFRYSIKTQSELVTLSDELNHVNDYISIQKIRFSNRFHVDIDIPEELYQYRVLKLILQPLVENSLYHGLEYCASGDQIIISARLQDSNIVIKIADNGQGITPENLAQIKQQLASPPKFQELGQRRHVSIGLKNIHSRIQLYYGGFYGLSIENNPTAGITVTITIPQLPNKEEA